MPFELFSLIIIASLELLKIKLSEINSNLLFLRLKESKDFSYGLTEI